MKKTLLLGIWMLGCVHTLIAQSTGGGKNQPDANDLSEHLIFENIKPEDGLPDSYTPMTFQDRQGFIWFANKKGLIRYDGLNFKIYQHDPQDPGSISNSFARFITQDHEGIIWVATHGGGLNRFDPLTETFSVFPLTSGGENTVSPGIIYSVMEDSQHRLWVGTRTSGLFIISPERDTVAHFLHDPDDRESLSGNEIGACYEDKHGRFWVPAGRNGLNLFDPESGKSFRFRHEPGNNNSLLPEFVLGLKEVEEQQFWIPSWNGLSVLDMKDTSFTHYFHEADNPNGLSSSIIYSLNLDSRDKVWLATGLGLNRYDPATKNFSHFFHDPLNPYSLVHDYVYSVYEANDGIIWVTTANGISKLRPNNFSFISFVNTLEEKKKSNFEGGYVDILEDSQGNIWVSTRSNGLFVYRPGSNTYRHFTPEPSWRGGNIEEDQNGRVWMNGNGKLYYYDPAIADLRSVCQEAPEICEGIPFLATFTFDRQGTLWVGGYGLSGEKSIYKIDTLAMKIVGQYPLVKPDGSSIIVGGGPISIGEHGNLWIGVGPAGGRLPFFNPRLERFSSVDLEIDITPNTFVPVVDSKGFIWLNNDTRLFRFKLDSLGNPVGKSEWPIDGGQIREDKKGRYWLVRPDGITAFDPAVGMQKTYSLKGITESLDGTLESTRSGGFYLGGYQGLFYFNPDQATENTKLPTVILTDLKLFNRSVPLRGSYGDTLAWKSPLERSIGFTEQIKLPHDLNDFTIEFVALDFHQPENNLYKYLLEGYNKDTVRTTAERPFASYTNLSPGNYTFRVWAANNDGNWNKEGTSLRIKILSPWYWAWWSKTLYLLVIAGALYGLHYWRTSEQRKRLRLQEENLAQQQLVNRRLQQIDKLKDQFLANTSHELRTPLHGIIGLTESLMGNINKRSSEELQSNLGMILTSGRRLASLVNDLLDFSRAKNKDIKLQLKSLDLKSVAEVVLHSCRPLTGNAALQLHNQIPDGLPAVSADENRLQQILYNLVGNAIKFTPSGTITIKAGVKNEMVEVCVADTGVGIPAEKQEIIFQAFEQADGDTAREYGGTGLGLNITKQLVELHGGKIWVESHSADLLTDQPEPESDSGGPGSKFFFTLPVAETPTQLITLAPETVSAVDRMVEEAELSESSAVEHSETMANASDATRILIVDDEPINHQVLRNYLSEDRFVITSVMNGIETMEAIAKGAKFDLVLLDVMMPRMSGYEVCQKIREHYLASEMPVIMVTAKDQIGDLIQGLDTGANDYITKPFSRDEFLARIKTHLNLHRIHEATNKFVPSDFLKTIGRNTITEVRLGDLQQRNVTVFFSDIRSYTSLSEKMSPEENFKFVNAYAGRMGPIIREHRGFVNQYLGDGIMAIFQNHPEDALKAAIEMQKELQRYNVQRLAQNRTALRVGMGMYTGPLIMGVIGDAQRSDAATISDTVNTAARMEGLTKYYGVNILLSEDSLRGKNGKTLKMKAGYHFRYLGLVQVKGKEKPLGIYECFDGDPEEIIEKKLQILNAFDESLQHFLGRDFNKAKAGFSSILDVFPQDKAAQRLLERAEYYRLNGTPPDWNGVEEMLSK